MIRDFPGFQPSETSQFFRQLPGLEPWLAVMPLRTPLALDDWYFRGLLADDTAGDALTTPWPYLILFQCAALQIYSGGYWDWEPPITTPSPAYQAYLAQHTFIPYAQG